VALADHPAAVVDQGEAAIEVVADDGQQRLEAAPLEDGVGQSLVHLERACELLELLACKVRDCRFRDGDERHLVRDREDGKCKFVRFLYERRRHLGEPEADSDTEAREPVPGEPAHVRALRRSQLSDTKSGREEELAAFEERGRISEFRDVEPADLVVEAV